MIHKHFYCLMRNVQVRFRSFACEIWYRTSLRFCRRMSSQYLTQTSVIPCFDWVSRALWQEYLADQNCQTKMLQWSVFGGYLQRLNGSSAPHKPIYSEHVNCLCNYDEIIEKSSRERWSLNAAFMRKLRAQRNGGGQFILNLCHFSASLCDFSWAWSTGV